MAPTTPTPRLRWIEYMPLAQLEPAPRNPKGHDLDGIRASIQRFGMIEVAAVMDERTGRIIGGHGRTEVLTTLAAAAAAGMEPPDGIDLADDGAWLVPVYRGWSSTNDSEAEAALIGVNQLTIGGGWRGDELAPMLVSLADTPAGLTGTGFTPDDLATLLASLEHTTPVRAHDRTLPDGDDPDEHVTPAEPVTRRGDVWQLGPHRLMCGDSRDADDVARLLDGATINLGVTSPPYAEQRDYDESSGFRPIPPDEYVDWFAPVAANVAEHLADDGSWVVNIKPGISADSLDTLLYVFDLALAHVRAWDWHLATEYCWERNGVPKTPTLRLKNQWEPVFQFARGRWKWRPDNVRHWSENVPQAQGPGVGNTNWKDNHGNGGMAGSVSFGGGAKPRKGGTTELMADVQGQNAAPGEFIGAGWAYPGNRLPTFNGTHEAVGHTAAYPVGLPAFFVRLLTDEQDVVYDPFTGSGSSLLAAHLENRLGYGMELSPGYCDMALARFQRRTGIIPVRDGVAHDFTT